MIVAAKVQNSIKWTDVARVVGQSKEWTAAACLGQMTFDKAQASAIGEIFGLPGEAVAWLQIVPYKGPLPSAVPTGPADLSLVRNRERIRNHDQGTDS